MMNRVIWPKEPGAGDEETQKDFFPSQLQLATKDGRGKYGANIPQTHSALLPQQVDALVASVMVTGLARSVTRCLFPRSLLLELRRWKVEKMIDGPSATSLPALCE